MLAKPSKGTLRWLVEDPTPQDENQIGSDHESEDRSEDHIDDDDDDESQLSSDIDDDDDENQLGSDHESEDRSEDHFDDDDDDETQLGSDIDDDDDENQLSSDHESETQSEDHIGDDENQPGSDHESEAQSEDHIDDDAASDDNLQKDDFMDWRDLSGSDALLVMAAPGQGKSVLSNFVVDQLNSHLEGEGDPRSSKVIYHFCHIKNEEQYRTASSVLRSLIVQLCMDPRLFGRLPNRFQDNRKEFHSAQVDELWKTFEDLVGVGIFTTIYCIIDGLDVYKTGITDLLTHLKTRMTQQQPAQASVLKLFCTTRPSEHLELDFFPRRKVLRARESDLDLFIKENPIDCDEHLKGYIRDRLLERSDGTFLWVSIVLKTIRDIAFPSEEDIDSTIYGIPTDLADLYSSLCRDVLRNPKFAAILAWITFAKQPMTLENLAVAVPLTIKPGIKRVSECEKGIVRLTRENIQRHLGILVEIANDTPYLIHQSLRDFLLRTDPWQQAGVDPCFEKPELAIANACMTFLALEDFHLQTESSMREDIIASKFPLFCSFRDYAGEFWYMHVKDRHDIKDMEKLRRMFTGPGLEFLLPSFIPYKHLRPVWRFATGQDIVWLSEMILEMAARSSGPDPSAAPKDDWLVEGMTSNSMYICDWLIEAAEESPRVFALLLDQPKAQVTEDVVLAAASSCACEETMGLLLEKRGQSVEVAEMLARAVLKDPWWEVDDVGSVLEKLGGAFRLTDEVMISALQHRFQARDNVSLLMTRYGQNFQISEAVLKETTKNLGGLECMGMLLDCGERCEITEGVVEEVAGYLWGGRAMMEMLLKKRKNEVKITEKVVRRADSYLLDWLRVMVDAELKKLETLLQTEPDDIRTALTNENGGCNLNLLLEKEEDGEFKAKNYIVQAAKDNGKLVEEVLDLLRERRGDM